MPAWQSFATGPYSRMQSSGRAAWPADLPQPPWVEGTFVNLELTSFDGKLLTGNVHMWARPGLDPNTCAVEVVWDSNAKQGVRLGGLPDIKWNPGGPTEITWKLSTPVKTSASVPRPSVIEASTYVFCPFNNAHVDRPWGVHFNSIEMVVAGPDARTAYCKQVRRGGERVSGWTKLAGHHTFDLRFACGALVRLRGRELVDECRGDVLLSLDALGKGVDVGGLQQAGVPLQDGELRGLVSHSSGCTTAYLRAEPKFGPAADRVFATFLKQAGARLEYAQSTDGRREPSIDFEDLSR
jgi:hypothetical protein